MSFYKEPGCKVVFWFITTIVSINLADLDLFNYLGKIFPNVGCYSGNVVNALNSERTVYEYTYRDLRTYRKIIISRR